MKRKRYNRDLNKKPEKIIKETRKHPWNVNLINLSLFFSLWNIVFSRQELQQREALTVAGFMNRNRKFNV